MFREILGAVGAYVKYKYKNKKPRYQEEWEDRENEINKTLSEGCDPNRIAKLFERMRRKSSGHSKQ